MANSHQDSTHADFEEAEAAFVDAYPFQDEVHGQILVNRLERDVIDTPEFQRLFRISQLGFVDLAFPTANHTRASHSIGACSVSKRLTNLARTNTQRMAIAARKCGHDRLTHNISRSEGVLISLGALLHDVSHGPYSHEVEKKTHIIQPQGVRIRTRSHYAPYPKHDDYAENPALYVILLDRRTSVLGRVLARYSPEFWNLMCSDSERHIAEFVQAVQESRWESAPDEILASLLFHLLLFEKPEDALVKYSARVAVSFDGGALREWGLGPRDSWKRLHECWYQPYRHDIIGDTLSSDLIDYLLRDCRRLGIGKTPDLRLLNFYILAPLKGARNGRTARGAGGLPLFDGQERGSMPLFRCAIDLNDYKRGTLRVERINDIFRLLDLRHEIHEKAVHHRVVQAAVAMLARAICMLPPGQRPSLRQFYGLHSDCPALAGEDLFMQNLIVAASSQDGGMSAGAQSIAQKLAERRVYRPLIVIPGDRVSRLMEGVGGGGLTDEARLRELAAITDSTYFAPYFLFISWCVEKLLEHALASEEELEAFILQTLEVEALRDWAMRCMPKRVLFWAAPYKQLYKDPTLLVCIEDAISSIEEIPQAESLARNFVDRVAAGIKDAETKYAELWRLYVFVSDGLFYTGMLAKLTAVQISREARFG